MPPRKKQKTTGNPPVSLVPGKSPRDRKQVLKYGFDQEVDSSPLPATQQQPETKKRKRVQPKESAIATFPKDKPTGSGNRKPGRPKKTTLKKTSPEKSAPSKIAPVPTHKQKPVDIKKRKRGSPQKTNKYSPTKQKGRGRPRKALQTRQIQRKPKDEANNPKNKAIESWLVGSIDEADIPETRQPHHSYLRDSSSGTSRYSYVDIMSGAYESIPPTEKSEKRAGKPKENKEFYGVTLSRDKPRFRKGLEDRLVSVFSSDDKRKNDFLKMIKSYNFPQDKVFNERRWQKDLARSRDSKEATFQRSAMMDMFDRDGLDSKLQWFTESHWAMCEHFPPCDPDTGTERSNIQKLFQISRPQPDLAFAFKANYIVQDRQEKALLKKVMNYILPEGQKRRDGQAFPFFFLEVKRAEASDGIHCGHLQNLNSTSHALRNIWKIMKNAGNENEFPRVRLLSATATPDKVEFRLHRADRAERWQENQGLALYYEFDELKTIPDDDDDPKLTEEAVQRVSQAFLQKYAAEELFPLLRNSVNKFATKEKAAKSGTSVNQAGDHHQPSSQNSIASRSSNKRSEPNGSFESRGTSRSKRLRKDMDGDPMNVE